MDLEEIFNKIFERDTKKSDRGFVDRFFGNRRDDDSDDDNDGPPGLPTVPPLPPDPTSFNENLLNELPLLEDTDPVIKSLREHYFPYSNRFEAKDYSPFDEDIES